MFSHIRDILFVCNCGGSSTSINQEARAGCDHEALPFRFRRRDSSVVPRCQTEVGVLFEFCLATPNGDSDSSTGSRWASQRGGMLTVGMVFYE